MAIWYIGAARGHGNPYGIVIATVSFKFYFTSKCLNLTKFADCSSFSSSLCSNSWTSNAEIFLEHDSNHSDFWLAILNFFVRMTGADVRILFQVVGYSWIDANQGVFGNPGIGVSLGWKRA